MKTNESFRQGDVFLIRVDSLPTDLEDITPKAGRVVLHHGEAAHHFHAFYNADARNVRVFVRPGATAAERRRPDYLRVVETVYLRHEEHTEAKLPPGIYRLPVQVEHTDAEEPIVVED